MNELPSTPTAAMLDAGRKALIARRTAGECYAAMVAAAPKGSPIPRAPTHSMIEAGRKRALIRRETAIECYAAMAGAA